MAHGRDSKTLAKFGINEKKVTWQHFRIQKHVLWFIFIQMGIHARIYMDSSRLICSIRYPGARFQNNHSLTYISKIGWICTELCDENFNVYWPH